MKIEELVTLIKLNKFFLNENENEKMKKTIMSKINKKSCLVIYCLSYIFKLPNSVKISMSLIEQLFPMFADSDNFLELEFNYIINILLSSGLNVDSELQVFNAVDSWLSHDIIKRSKYAKNLLSMVRLPLLSIPALKQVLNRVSIKYHEFAITIEVILVEKQQSHPFSSNIISRYCNQTNFNILVCGGESCDSNNIFSDVKLFNANNYSEVNYLPNMKQERTDFVAVYIKGEVYVFDGKKVEKYSPDTNTWEYVINMMDDRIFFSACSFMDNVYIIGGQFCHVIGEDETATCFELNTKSLKWKEVSRMNTARDLSACSVFEGRIIISGGRFHDILNTVEAYDHVGNSWENIVNMVIERCGHKSVAVKNKLFAIG